MGFWKYICSFQKPIHLLRVRKMKSNETIISRKKPFKANKLWPFFFAAPFLIAYFIFSLFPTLYSFYLSLYDWNGFSPKVFIGLKNYIDLLTIDPLFYKSLST